MDPFIIEGWEIDASLANGIDVRNTRAQFVVRNVFVHSGLGRNSIYLVNVANVRVETSDASNNGNGIGVFSSEYVELMNNTFHNNGHGVHILNSSNITIINNNISTNEAGIVFFQSSNGLISENQILLNSQVGLDLEYSTNTTLRKNIFAENGVVLFSGSSLTHLNSHTITQDNLVNGKPLHYYKDCSGLSIDGISVGQLIVVNCSNVQVSNLQISHADIGMEMAFVGHALIEDNDLFSNHDAGLLLLGISDSIISGNTFNGNGKGIDTYASNNTVIADNDISSNGDRGIQLFTSANVTISGNSVANNSIGLFMSYSNSISVHHNNLVNNLVQARQWVSAVVSWDDGYPNGGNFWSDYDGPDNCSGPDQSICPSPDGIGDISRLVGIIDWCSDYATFCVVSHAPDRYPLVSPFVSVVMGTFDSDPGTVNLRSKGRYISAYIELASPHDVRNIDVSTIRLNEALGVAPRAPVSFADHDEDGILDLMVKFDLAGVKALFSKPGTYRLQITGRFVVGGNSFDALATVRVLS